MSSPLSKLSGATVLAISLLSLSVTAHAEDRAAKEARAGIQAAIDTLVATLKKGTTGEVAADLFYTEDAIVSASGYGKWDSRAAFLPTLKEWVAYPVCDWKLDPGSVHASGQMASAWVTETCAAQKAGDPPTVMHNLYVFRKTPKGWRAVAEALTTTKK